MKTIKNDLEAATLLAEQRLDAARSLLNNEEAAKEAAAREAQKLQAAKAEAEAAMDMQADEAD